MKDYRILAINPGSTSTKIALFDGDEPVFTHKIEHTAEELDGFSHVDEQLDYRKQAVLNVLAENGVALESVDAFSGRGGGLLPMEGGVYEVSDLLFSHAQSRGSKVQHPARLGPQIARALADQLGVRSFTVNPPDVDEFDALSRITGLHEVERVSRIHALNQKEIAYRYAQSKGRAYEDMNLIVAHIGGGISVTAHRKGRMADSNDITSDGPMAPTRAGSLPPAQLVELCYSGKFTQKQMGDRLIKNGGLVDHLGTSDGREIRARIAGGDTHTKLIYDAMIYQIAKSVGECAVTLKGSVDAILLTGGLSNDPYLTGTLTEYIAWIAQVAVIPGEFEMEALAYGALRVLRGELTPKVYTGKI